MLKNKLRSLEKEMKKMNTGKRGIFFVGIEHGDYIVKSSPGMKTVFQGNKKEFDNFSKEYEEGSVFVIDDIPREKNGTNIFDWVN